MKTVVSFLQRFGEVLDAMKLAADRHTDLVTVREGNALDALRHLLVREGEAVFDFVDGEVYFAGQRVRRLPDWKWTHELSRGAIERIEISRGVAREEFLSFLEVLLDQMRFAKEGATEKAVLTSKVEFPNIRFGRRDTGQHGLSGRDGPDSPSWLQVEVEATGRLLGQAARGVKISHSLAGAVVESLAMALRREETVPELLIPVERDDRYTAIHSVNAALLTMGLAEVLGFTTDDIIALGEAAILFDVGATGVPDRIMKKPGELTRKEWEILKRHPVEGARMLMESGQEMELAAVVAYEHHIRYDGSGYPDVPYARKIHRATQVIQVCDVYDALRSRRPFRDPWPVDRIVPHLQSEGGKSLYPDAVEAFTWMLA